MSFISAFRERGIFPDNVPNLSVDTLVWGRPTLLVRANVRDIVEKLDLNWDRNSDRHEVYDRSRRNARTFHEWLVGPGEDVFRALGFRKPERDARINDVIGELRPLEVHSVRPARRVGPERTNFEVIIEITQSFWPGGDFQRPLRSGCTIIIDHDTKKIRYMVGKRLNDEWILKKQNEVSGLEMRTTEDAVSLRESYYGDSARRDEPFAFLHVGH